MATLTKSGSSFALGDLRSYDAWGNVLGTNATGRPRGRYVANLGHVQDDESSLVYMRARYYEPGSGRFVSEDPARDGLNWFAYCGNDPVNYSDSTGKAKKSDILEFEEAIRRLLREGRISQEYFDRIMDRTTDLRRVIHDAITGQGLSLDEIANFIEDDFKMRGKGLQGIGIGLTTLDTAFQQDPVFVMGLLEDIFGGGNN